MKIKVVFLSILLAGCSATDQSQIQLEGQEWIVTSINGTPSQIGSMLRIEDDRIEGIAGCNRFFGPVNWIGDHEFKVSPLATSQKQCHPDDQSMDFMFLQMYSLGVTYHINGETLTLQSGESIAQFMPYHF
ncbi:META domain-containing protein [Vibrio sp.]|nr:META domain-containing protein [Vibrio sp.]